MMLANHITLRGSENAKSSTRRAATVYAFPAAQSPAGEVNSRMRSVADQRSEQAVQRVPLTFWTPDGSCHEGMTPCAEGDLMFVETTKPIPVGTQLTIRIVQCGRESLGWALAEGTVVWRCLSADLFHNGKGVGVSLQGRWPRLYGPDDGDEPKGTA